MKAKEIIKEIDPDYVECACCHELIHITRAIMLGNNKLLYCDKDLDCIARAKERGSYPKNSNAK